MFGKNWKTSSAGLAMILAAVAEIIQGYSAGTVNWQISVTAIITGIGLLFAKDANVTGGTVVQPTSSAAIVEKAQEQKDLGFHGKVPLDPGLIEDDSRTDIPKKGPAPKA